ncbi:MAG: integrase [Rhodothermaceae bacterium]|nr:MAG: integrase [Rhodothermaceae bacterium]
MASVRIVQRKDKTRADGTAPLYVRITARRRSRYVSTGIYVEPRHFNEARQEVRRSHPLSDAYNARLADLRLEAERAALEADAPEAVKDALQGRAGSLTRYFERFIEGLEQAGQYWERKKYRTTLRKLRACLGEEIDFADLDREALRRFEVYLRDRVGNRPNTRRKEFARLRRVVRQAVKDGVIPPERDALAYFDLPKGERPVRRKLTLEEVRALEAADLERGRARNAPNWPALARDAFVLAFYAGGMRVSDVCNLRRRHIERDGDTLRVRYRQLKTGNPVSMPLPPPARRIVERYLAGDDPDAYVMPFLRDRDTGDGVRLRRAIGAVNVMLNRGIKEAARVAGLERPEMISMHTARHSFADYARSRTGDLYAVSRALGHSSLQVTQAYLKSFDEQAVDNLARELWSDTDR